MGWFMVALDRSVRREVITKRRYDCGLASNGLSRECESFPILGWESDLMRAVMSQV